MIRLSPRLQLLLDQATRGEPLWDLCCDHGLLGLRALETGEFPEVHFVDQVPHIMERLRSRLGDQAGAFVHLTDASLLMGSVRGSVIIAGVGGTKILQILDALSTRESFGPACLVLCPQKDERDFAVAIGEFASRFGFVVGDVVEVREGPRVRSVWALRRAKL